MSQACLDSRACLLSTSPPCLRKCWKNKGQFALRFLLSGSGLQRALFEAQAVHLNQGQLHGHMTYVVSRRAPCVEWPSALVLEFLIIFKQGVSRFHFALGPTYYMASPGFDIVCPLSWSFEVP